LRRRAIAPIARRPTFPVDHPTTRYAMNLSFYWYLLGQSGSLT
jgi:hypothetical protein